MKVAEEALHEREAETAVRPVVAVLRTSPETVLEDYSRLLRLLDYQRLLPKDRPIILKLNLSWTKFFPSVSTPPWQLDGVLKTLQEDGYDLRLVLPVENRTVVTNAEKGARLNLWTKVLRKYGLKFIPLTKVKWVRYDFKSPLLRLPELFPQGIRIPALCLGGKSVVHLPTVKTHGHSITTGAIKNAFGLLLDKFRHYGHKFIHEVLVDILLMEHELFPVMLAVMDGTLAGDKEGPRIPTPRVKNVILASFDQVAIDALAAKIMGFDPWDIPYLRMAHEMGLGCADLSRVEVVGDADVALESWGFTVKRSLVIFGDQVIRRGPLRPLEWLLLKSPLWVWAPLASNFYHDLVWYPLRGIPILRQFRRTGWGRLFEQYRGLEG